MRYASANLSGAMYGEAVRERAHTILRNATPTRTPAKCDVDEKRRPEQPSKPVKFSLRKVRSLESGSIASAKASGKISHRSRCLLLKRSRSLDFGSAARELKRQVDVGLAFQDELCLV